MIGGTSLKSGGPLPFPNDARLDGIVRKAFRYD